MLTGTRSIEIGVDEDGFIFLGYDADRDDEAEFIWRKNYTEPIDSSRAHEETKTEGYGTKSAHTKLAGMLVSVVLISKYVNTDIRVIRCCVMVKVYSKMYVGLKESKLIFLLLAAFMLPTY